MRFSDAETERNYSPARQAFTNERFPNDGSHTMQEALAHEVAHGTLQDQRATMSLRAHGSVRLAEVE